MDELFFDAALAAILVLLGWRVVASARLFTAAVLFITFGLSLALVWARLGALDIALIEAAIGAGLLGALLIDAVGSIERRDGRQGP